MKYDFQAIEKKWQARWETEKPFAAVTGDPRPKFYGLIEFPYPSGQGLHVGHPRPFTAMDTVGIQRRGLKGYLKSFIKPFLLMLPLNLIEQIVRPFSLALRLYGNLYGEEMVTHELGNLFPLVLPLLMQVLSLLFCLIQAVVFTMLLSTEFCRQWPDIR